MEIAPLSPEAALARFLGPDRAPARGRDRFPRENAASSARIARLTLILRAVSALLVGFRGCLSVCQCFCRRICGIERSCRRADCLPGQHEAREKSHGRNRLVEQYSSRKFFVAHFVVQNKQLPIQVGDLWEPSSAEAYESLRLHLADLRR